jgi:predicted tellurium resistance membrane protein TerC
MKTIITSVKKIICNVLLFLISLQLTYSVVNHHVYGTPYPHLFIIIVCLLVATFASIKKEKDSKQ